MSNSSQKLEVGCAENEVVERDCARNIFQLLCPRLSAEQESIRIHVSVGAYGAAVSFLSDQREHKKLIVNENEAIELLVFACKNQSPVLKEAAKTWALETDFKQFQVSSLINYHSTLLTHKFWSGNKVLEKKLLAEISRRGSEVLKNLAASKEMCFDTVKKILKQQRLNVFSEKEVFDCIYEWRTTIIKAAEEDTSITQEEFNQYVENWKDKLLPLIRFDIFSFNDAIEFIDDQTSTLSTAEKIQLLHKTSSRTISLEKKSLLPMLTVTGNEFSLEAPVLNFRSLSPWRGNFIPFTETTMFLKPAEDAEEKVCKGEQTLNVQPLKWDLYLLSVGLYNLQSLQTEPITNRLLLSVSVIREKDGDTESKTDLEWKDGQPKHHFMLLSNPCLLKKGQKYIIKVTNLRDQFEPQNFYQLASDGQEHGDILQVCGTGNICGLGFAVATSSMCAEQSET